MRRRVRKRPARAGRAVERARAELQPVQVQPGWGEMGEYGTRRGRDKHPPLAIGVYAWGV
jgi:hypothetical protein